METVLIDLCQSDAESDDDVICIRADKTDDVIFIAEDPPVKKNDFNESKDKIATGVTVLESSAMCLPHVPISSHLCSSIDLHSDILQPLNLSTKGGSKPSVCSKELKSFDTLNLPQMDNIDQTHLSNPNESTGLQNNADSQTNPENSDSNRNLSTQVGSARTRLMSISASKINKSDGLFQTSDKMFINWNLDKDSTQSSCSLRKRKHSSEEHSTGTLDNKIGGFTKHKDDENNSLLPDNSVLNKAFSVQNDKEIFSQSAVSKVGFCGDNSKPLTSVHYKQSGLLLNFPISPQFVEEKSKLECFSCNKLEESNKLSLCKLSHTICGPCIEPKVKDFLSGKNKQHHIKCPMVACLQFFELSELKKSLPSLIIEILEEKINNMYLNYVTKWMFSDKERLKSRDEFTSSPTPSSNVQKCERLFSQKFDKASDNLPTHWKPMDNDTPILMFEVEANSPEFISVASLFHTSLKFPTHDIVRIYRVQNQILWKYYSLKKSEMMQESSCSYVNEMQLFHGTSLASLEPIARKGFDWRLSGKHGTVYGKGSYFAKNASYSHNYTDRGRNAVRVRPLPRPRCPNSFVSSLSLSIGNQGFQGVNVSGINFSSLSNYNLGVNLTSYPTFQTSVSMETANSNLQKRAESMVSEKGTNDLKSALKRGPTCSTHFMFAARVLTGQYTTGNQSHLRPPPIDSSDPMGKSYDSCVDNWLDPHIFVIFNDKQAYPEYIIEYN